MRTWLLLFAVQFSAIAQPFTLNDAAFVAAASSRLPRSGLIAEYFFNEGSGQTVYNHAVEKPLSMVNLCQAPEQMFAVSSLWNPVNTLTITENYSTNQSGVQSASRVVAASGGARYLECKTKKITYANTPYTFSVYVKATAGVDQPFRIGWSSSSDGYHWSADQTATVNWTRFSITYTPTAGPNGNVVVVSTDSANNAFDVVIWGAQLELGSSATPYSDPNHHGYIGQNRTVDTLDPFWTTAGVNLTNTRAVYSISSTSISTSNLTVYCVARRTGTNSNFEPLVSNYDTGDKWHLRHNYGSVRYPGFDFNGAIARGAAISMSDYNYHMLCGSFDGLVCKLFFDNIQVTALSAPKAAVTVNQIGIGELVWAFYWPGDIAYAAVYSTTHSSNQVRTSFSALRQMLNPRGVLLNKVDRLVVLDGDSITDQYASLAPNARYWYLGLTNITPRVQGVNFATSGEGTVQMTARAESVDALYDPERAENIVSVFIGTNDLVTSMTAATCFANLKSYCLARIARGWKVIVGTCLPRTGLDETKRTSFNSLITGDPSFYNAVFDFASDPTMGDPAAPSNTTLYETGGVHPTALGHDYLWGYWNTAMESAIAQ